MVWQILRTPLLYWIISGIAAAAVAKAPLPEYWLHWAGFVAAATSTAAGLLTNPQHLMTILKAEDK